MRISGRIPFHEKPRVRGSGRRGLTLIEVLVTTAILGVLAAMLLPGLSRARNLARRTACLSNLRQLGIATAAYLADHHDRFLWVAEEDLQLTPPVNASGKRYTASGGLMPLLHPYQSEAGIWWSPPVPHHSTNDWRRHFVGVWRQQGINDPGRGAANYISDKLAELDPEQPRYLRGRTPESVALRRGTSVSDEEWLMSPFFERGWWAGFAPAWAVGASVPPSGGWSAHHGGRNQLYLDLRAQWIRRDILR